MSTNNKALVCSFALSMICFAAYAQTAVHAVTGFNGHMLPLDPSLNIAATYTPPQFEGIAKAHGWIELDDEEDARWWMAYVQGRERNDVVQVAVKRAMKGAGEGFVSIQILNGEAICPEDGSAPNYLLNVMDMAYDEHGIPTAGGMVTPVLALTRGSILSEGIFQACSHRDKDIPSGDFKPQAKYPASAIIMNHEGITVVGYKIGDNGSIGRSNVWIVKSSGFADLDASALEAVSHWRIQSKPAGTQSTTNITFSLNLKK